MEFFFGDLLKKFLPGPDFLVEKDSNVVVAAAAAAAVFVAVFFSTNEVLVIIGAVSIGCSTQDISLLVSYYLFLIPLSHEYIYYPFANHHRIRKIKPVQIQRDDSTILAARDLFQEDELFFR